MIDFPILSLLVFLPLIGAIFLMTIRGRQAQVAKNAKHAALFTAFFSFALSVYLLLRFDPANAEFQFVERYEWFPSLGISYYLGLDGISLFMVLLSSFLTPVAMIASWNSISDRLREFMMLFLVLESFMIGTFVALDTVLFYVFFEGVLIPMFLIIGIWGGKNRIYAAFKFFLFTLLGSVLMLLGLIALYAYTGTTSLPEMVSQPIPPIWQYTLFLAFLASFAIKLPLWPVHTWLPDAHVEAPTGGSVILAGVLLKMGAYGFLRFSLPLFPLATECFAPLLFCLGVIGILYTSLIALVQDNMKKLIAYSSVAHMGFCILGIFSVTVQGIEGGIFQMISHGIVSAALFFCVGILYQRTNTLELNKYGGLVNIMPVFAALFMIFTLGSLALPGTSGFIGEFLSLLGLYQINTAMTAIAAIGTILGAAYMLRLYKKIMFGKTTENALNKLDVLDLKEKLVLVPMAALVLWIGISPSFILDRIEPAVNKLFIEYNTALEQYNTDLIQRQEEEHL